MKSIFAATDLFRIRSIATSRLFAKDLIISETDLNGSKNALTWAEEALTRTKETKKPKVLN